MRHFLKSVAMVCKVIAIIAWLALAWCLVGLYMSGPNHWNEAQDWGTPAYYHRVYLEIAGICGYIASSTFVMGKRG